MDIENFAQHLLFINTIHMSYNRKYEHLMALEYLWHLYLYYAILYSN
jgi:hypothetical protein